MECREPVKAPQGARQGFSMHRNISAVLYGQAQW
jgi:hypothetical protein